MERNVAVFCNIKAFGRVAENDDPQFSCLDASLGELATQVELARRLDYIDGDTVSEVGSAADADRTE
jgi:hypothetical protein